MITRFGELDHRHYSPGQWLGLKWCFRRHFLEADIHSAHIVLFSAFIRALVRLGFDCLICWFCIVHLFNGTPSKVITNMPDGLRSLSCIMGLFIHRYLLNRILLDVWRPLVSWPDVCLCNDMSGAYTNLHSCDGNMVQL